LHYLKAILRMLEIFNAPVFEDTERTRKAQVLHSLIKGTMLILSIVLIIFIIVVPHNYQRWITAIMLIDLPCLVFLFLNKKGFTTLASSLFSGLSIGIVVLMSTTAEGIKAPAWQIIPVLILMVGLTRGWKSGIVVGLLVSIYGLGLVAAEYWNVLPSSRVAHNALTTWLGSFASIALIAMLQYNAVEYLNKAFKKVNEELNLRKKVEKELLKSETFRKRVFETSNTPIVVMEGGSFKFIDCNQAAINIYGYHSREETLGKTVLSVSAPFQYDGQSSSEKAKQQIDKAIEKGDIIFEWLHQRPNGEFWDAEVHLTSFYSENQLFLQFNLKDITESKKIEKELKESEEKYRYLMENMNEVLMMVDNDDRVQFVNKKFTDTLGYAPNEIIGEIGYKKLLDPADHKIIIAENKNRIEKNINQYELSFIAKNGQKIDFLVNGAPMIDPDGNTIGSIGTMTDITSRKQAEKALLESEELFKNLIDLTPYAISLNNFQGKYLMVNKAFCDDWGFAAHDVIGKQKEEIGLYVGEELEELMKNEILQKGFCQNIEGTIQSNRGKTIYGLFSSRVIQMNNQNVLLTSSVNITEKKKIEKELEKYRNHLEMLVKERTDELAATNEELNVSNEDLFEQREELQASLNKLNETQKRLIQSEKMASLGILSAGIAHEINNPLNFIQGGILVIDIYSKSNLKEHLHELNPFIDAILTGVKRAADIVTSLSHYSRKDEFPTAECNIHSIIDHCLIILQNQLKNKVEIEKQYTDKPSTFIGSEGKMHQAILNIISNAEQAIEVKGSIKIKTELVKNELIITFKDSGSGISPENLHKIFDPFFTTKAPGKGTGLGLAITFNIIHDHHGTIEYDSIIGHGTTAIIKLPINKNNKHE